MGKTDLTVPAIILSIGLALAAVLFAMNHSHAASAAGTGIAQTGEQL